MGEEPGGTRVWTRAQLHAAGMKDTTIANHCRSGAYQRLMPGIYCLGPPTALDKCRAVSLWRADAVLSHRTAAWLWGLLPEPPHIEVTVPSVVRASPPDWARLYRRDLSPAECSWAQMLPVVCRERAILDSLHLLPRADAERLVDEHTRFDQQREDLISLCSVDRAGMAVARAVVATAAQRWASEPERLLGRTLARIGCRLEPNNPVLGYAGDLVDQEARLVVEIDGRGFHSEREVFTHDRRRQNAIVIADWLVLRYSADDVFERTDQIALEIKTQVRKRRRRARDRRK
ncbi:DUF559 domain-containing protein [Tomitella biformata]|uniref:DUF559 domain-containing protein n=1 Tax=Tomitella biformata TaxID=630403 RepID=UPI00056E99A0|nr:DUF559 domain-containing protein [Tomitella biformata]